MEVVNFDDWVLVKDSFLYCSIPTSATNFNILKSVNNSFYVEKIDKLQHCSKSVNLTLKQLEDIHSKFCEICEEIPPLPFVNKCSETWLYKYFSNDITVTQELCDQINIYLRTVHSLLDAKVFDYILFSDEFDVDQYMEDMHYNRLKLFDYHVKTAQKLLENHLAKRISISSMTEMKKYYDLEDSLLYEWQKVLLQWFYLKKLSLHEIQNSAHHRIEKKFNVCVKNAMEWKKEKLEKESNVAEMNAAFFMKTAKFFKDSLTRMLEDRKHYGKEEFDELASERLDRITEEFSNAKIEKLLNQQYSLKLKLAAVKKQMKIGACHPIHEAIFQEIVLKLIKKQIETYKEVVTNKLWKKRKIETEIRSRRATAEILYDALEEHDSQFKLNENNSKLLAINFSEEHSIIKLMDGEIGDISRKLAKLRVKMQNIKAGRNGKYRNQNSFQSSLKLELSVSNILVKAVDFPEVVLNSSSPPPPPPPPLPLFLPLLSCPSFSVSVHSPAIAMPLKVGSGKEKDKHFEISKDMLQTAKLQLKKPVATSPNIKNDNSGFQVTTSQLVEQLGKLKSTSTARHQNSRCIKLSAEDECLKQFRDIFTRIRHSINSCEEENDDDNEDDFDDFD